MWQQRAWKTGMASGSASSKKTCHAFSMAASEACTLTHAPVDSSCRSPVVEPGAHVNTTCMQHPTVGSVSEMVTHLGTMIACIASIRLAAVNQQQGDV